jgi:hypothetical protein
MTINFENRTDFFTTTYEDEKENTARVRLYNKVCDSISDYIAKGLVNGNNTLLMLAKVHGYFKRNYNHIDPFMDLWRDEEYAHIVYADEVCTDHGTAFIVAFEGRGFIGSEVNIYEF